MRVMIVRKMIIIWQMRLPNSDKFNVKDILNNEHNRDVQ